MKWTFAPVALAAILAACSSPAPPRDNFYRLDVAVPVEQAASPHLPGVLEINRLDSDGVLAERALAYQGADGALARYRYDLWAEAPGTLVQEHLAEALRKANMAGKVVTPDLRVPPDWALRGKLKRFELLPEAGRVAVRMELSVVSARDGSLVMLETYDAQAPSAAEPRAAVAALGRATQDVIARFVADLRRAEVPQQRR